ncbi:hypothetical protein [Staphylococcus pseudintermedius]|uniref:hypothetical protein n=1 Tax=Staphylococcus pseudintermedius TaxID=283734 RepID=UPI00286E3EC2|nr:hypothetical protein [Staphylococcus pseudintermedius]WMZ45509.1 hypothetical protein QS415_13660 [Staphylococcus pseudintermedius]
MLNDTDVLSDTDVDVDALSESLVDVLVDLLNDAESLSDTDVDFDALSESLVDVLVDLLNEAEWRNDDEDYIILSTITLQRRSLRSGVITVRSLHQ